MKNWQESWNSSKPTPETDPNQKMNEQSDNDSLAVRRSLFVRIDELDEQSMAALMGVKGGSGSVPEGSAPDEARASENTQ